MPVTSDQLLEPAGDLTPVEFPGFDAPGLATLLTAYITDGAGRVAALALSDADKDRATIAYAYMRAYRNVANRMSRTPASYTLEGEGSRTVLTEQIRTYKESAQRWADEFDAIAATEPTPDETPSAPATNNYVW